MPLATEIVFLQLKEGINPEEAGSSGALQWKKCATTISEQQGWIRQFWGLQVENPKILILTVDWDDVQDHKNFVNSEAYKPFTAELAEIFDFEAMPPSIYHVNFTSDSVAVREAPVTEFAPFSLAASATTEEKSSLEDKILALAKHCSDNAKCTGSAAGWALEERDNPNAPDAKTTLLQALLGWPSVDDHMAARETSEFKELVTPVRSSIVPPAPGLGMFHVKLHGKPKA